MDEAYDDDLINLYVELRERRALVDERLDSAQDEARVLWRALWCVAKLYWFMLFAAVLFALLLKWAM